MKRFMKRIMSAVFAVVMLMGMSVNAFAQQAAAPATGSITVNGAAGRTFEAYRLFDLSYSQVEEDIKYNYTEVNAEVTKAVTDALKKVDTSYVGTTAADAVKKLGTYTPGTSDDEAAKADKKEAMEKFARELQKAGLPADVKTELVTSGDTATASNLPFGYYVVFDTTDMAGEYDAVSLAMISTMSPDWVKSIKANFPTIQKKVAKEEDRLEYADVADYDINDQVPFKLTGTIPSMAGYETYEYEIYDNESEGLTFNPSSVRVYFAKEDVQVGADIINVKKGITNPAVTVVESVKSAYPESGFEKSTFAVKFADLKALKGDKDVNQVVVEYTSELNENAKIGAPGNPNDVYLEFSNKPYESGQGTGGGEGEEENKKKKGKAPVDRVVVFTYEMDVTKVEEGTATTLANAQFEIYKGSVADENILKFKESEKPEEAKGTVYVDPTGVTTYTTDATGIFNIKGLDAGTYYLKETKAPDGYNILKGAIKVEITASYNEMVDPPELESLTATIDDSGVATDIKANGTAKVTVENSTGAVLPSTGGMGTTILYVVGILAMAGGLFYFAMSRKSRQAR